MQEVVPRVEEKPANTGVENIRSEKLPVDAKEICVR
jgi:hypothetical protein